MNSLTVREWGALERVHVDRDSRNVPAGRVRVRVRYAGAGFADLMAVAGKYPLAPKRPFSPGYEAFGTVAEIGARVDGAAPCELQPGRRVVAMLPHMGAYRGVVDLSPQWLVPVPDGVDDETAAQLPLNYLTALRSSSTPRSFGRGSAYWLTAPLELARLLGISAFGTARIPKHDVIRSLGGTPGIIAKDPAWYRSSLGRLLSWARDGRINPALHAVVPSERAEEAHRVIAERRLLRQGDGRVDHRTVQDRSDPALRSVADSGSGGACHLRVGGLVQQPEATRTNRR